MRLSAAAGVISCKVITDGEFLSLGLLSHGGQPLLVCFYDAHYVRELEQNPDIACVLTTAELSSSMLGRTGLAVCEDPIKEFYALHEHLYRNTSFYGEDFPTEVAPDAIVHETAYVAARNVRIGSRTVIEPKAVILERSIIGSNVRIRAGAVIGGEGFEPKWVAGAHLIIPHAGGVRIGNDAEVMCNSHVARAVFGSYTEIGDGSKVDALVHIAHNAVIGRNCEIAAGAVICGSATLGDRVWIGPNAMISSEVRVGDGAFVTLGSVAIHDVKPGARVTGYFAMDHAQFKRGLRRFAEA